jgi:hypothetical protein
MNFRNQYNRLPCPSDITLIADSTPDNDLYGDENVVSGVCTPTYTILNQSGTTTVEGGVPTRALNLPDEFMFDGWGRRFFYAADRETVKSNAFSIIPPEANNCALTMLDAATTNRSAGAMYVLISFGKNGHGAFVSGATRINAGVSTVAERTNC